MMIIILMEMMIGIPMRITMIMVVMMMVRMISMMIMVMMVITMITMMMITMEMMDDDTGVVCACYPASDQLSPLPAL